jgi:hypothetical protein
MQVRYESPEGNWGRRPTSGREFQLQKLSAADLGPAASQANGGESSGRPPWQGVDPPSFIPATAHASDPGGGSPQQASAPAGVLDPPQRGSGVGGLLAPVRRTLGRLTGAFGGDAARKRQKYGGYKVPDHWRACMKDGRLFAQEKIER